MIFDCLLLAANIYGFMALLKAFSGASLFILHNIVPAFLASAVDAAPNKENKSAQEIGSMDFSPPVSSNTFSNNAAHKKLHGELQGRMEIPLCVYEKTRLFFLLTGKRPALSNSAPLSFRLEFFVGCNKKIY